MLSNQEINKEFYGIKSNSDYKCRGNCKTRTCDITDGKCHLNYVFFRFPKSVIEIDEDDL